MADEALTIVVDGQEIPARPGQTVIQAALDAGIHIPYLCYYPSMKPYGACRMCVVEIEGQGGTPASCTLPVAPNMVVNTKTPGVEEIRRDILEFLVSEHPHGCLTCHRIELCGPQDICLRHVSVYDRCVACPKNERCELKDNVRSIGVDMNPPFTYNHRGLTVHTDDPFYDRDYNLCIVCGRCVRACEEVRGDDAIAFVERAGHALVGTSRGTSLLESGCEFCGACIDVCPVGALVERDYKWDKAVKRAVSVCDQCPVGCQVRLEVNRRNKIIRTVGGLEGAANRGQLCFKGKFGLDYPNSGERLRRPLVRRNGALEEATWEEAVSVVAEGLRQHTGNEFALLADARATNEENYLAQKFARVVMGTNNVDHSSNLRPELVTGLADTLGYMAATNPVWDLERSGCIVTVGANVTEEHNVVGVPIKRAVKQGAKLIVIDPREVELTRYAHLWLRPHPGTEAALVGGILRIIVDEVGEDAEFAGSCDGLGELKGRLASQFHLERVERITGLPRERIQEAARLYARSGPAAILYALDNVSPDHATDIVHAIGDLALLTGNVGKPGAGVYPLRQGANGQGSWDVGCVPTLLPGYAFVGDEAARGRVSAAWGAPSLSAEAGLGLRDLPAAIHSGGVKALWLSGYHTSYNDGELGDFLGALGKLDFLIVQDSFVTELAEHATVVLPATTFAEEEGTFTNLERRVQPLRRALELRNNESRPGWRILCEVARAMGAEGFGYEGAAHILNEIGQVVPEYGGISWQRLSRWQARIFPMYEEWPGHPIPQQLYPVDTGEPSAVQWPCPSSDHPGTPVLCADGFPRGKARFAPLELREPPQTTTQDYPLLFVPGRVLHDPDRAPEVDTEDGLNQVKRREILEIHPEDARRLGVTDGEEVEVVTDRGLRLRAAAHLHEAVHKGTVASTALFGSLMVELERNDQPDRMARVQGLPIRPARLEKVEETATA